MAGNSNSIISNMMAMNGSRQLGIVTDRKQKSMEKLASGYKINRAADDAAGLAISEKMRRQIRGLNQSAENILEGRAFCQVADGALDSIHGMLDRMTELSVQAANGTVTDEDRRMLDLEIQQIKSECNRIFTETSYNEKPIWKADDIRQIGTVTRRAVQPSGNSTSFDIRNTNYDKVPANGFNLEADATNGVRVKWNDYNNDSHATEYVSWETLEAGNYSFRLSDYFGSATGANADLYDGGGNPIFDHTISFRPHDNATIDDMVTAVNGQNVSTGVSASMNPAWENADTTGNLSLGGASLYYQAAYASRHNSADGYNFDAADDVFLEPVLSGGGGNLSTHPTAQTVEDAKTDNTGWQFTFQMKGIGEVKATVNSISYSCNDYDDEDENRWWGWNTIYYSDGSTEQRKAGYSHSAGNTLQSFMNSLTGNLGSLSKNPATGEAGMNDGSASYVFYLDIKSTQPFTYAGNSTSDVGSMTMSFSIGQSDTQQTVLDKINRALNDTTVLDFSKPNANYDHAYFYSLSPGGNTIEEPVFGGICNIPIQSGPEADHVIDLTYEELSLFRLGIIDTDVLTQDNAQKAIEEVREAKHVVSEQRALFGAYQNRLEHAYNVNMNAAENTQAAESLIRDTDMALEMVRFSEYNILQQAGESMLAQANQSKQNVLNLLQE